MRRFLFYFYFALSCDITYFEFLDPAVRCRYILSFWKFYCKTLKTKQKIVTNQKRNPIFNIIFRVVCGILTGSARVSVYNRGFCNWNTLSLAWEKKWMTSSIRYMLRFMQRKNYVEFWLCWKKWFPRNHTLFSLQTRKTFLHLKLNFISSTESVSTIPTVCILLCVDSQTFCKKAQLS